MDGLLCNLHQDCDQRWVWFGIFPGTDRMIVSRRSWENRLDAERALTCFLDLLQRIPRTRKV